MSLYDQWCDAAREEDGRKKYWCLVEKAGGRDAIRASLAETVRSHYDRLDRIADDVARLGYEGAAEILRAQLPQTSKGRSGDLGEILATELVEEGIGLRVPVRRLRYKDGRNMAMRGDDFMYPDRPLGLPELREPAGIPKFNKARAGEVRNISRRDALSNRCNLEE